MKPWPERFPDRFEAERQHWLGRGFEQKLTASGAVHFTGDVTLRLSPRDGDAVTKTFTVRVIYPPGYPYKPPDVEFIEPKVTRSRHMAAGEPCLYPPRLWDMQIPADEIERKIEDWLRGHELKSFPRELPLYELPAYYAYAAPTIFITDKVLPSMEGRHAGRFALVEFQGYDIAVVKSVDTEKLGESLMHDVGLPTSVGRVLRNGRWYRLEEEPPPIRNTGELSAILASSGHQLTEPTPRPGPVELVGLVFEDRHLGGTQWLMLDYGVTTKKATRPIHFGWPLRAPRVHVVSRAELFKRLTGVRDVAALDEKRITIFGLGAIGSHAALALAREGVGEFRLCDPDRLRPGNVVRHALDLTAVGRHKAEAMAQAIHRTNPFSFADFVTEGLGDPHNAQAYYKDASLVLAMIGDDAKEEMLTEIAVTGDERPPVLIARTLRGGDAIRLILVRPGRDPCMTCLRLHRDDQHPSWVEVPDDELPDVYDEGCATASRPGSGLASHEAAVMATERSIALLEGRDDDTNQWLHLRTPIEGGDARLGAVGTRALTLPIHAECLWCGGT